MQNSLKRVATGFRKFASGASGLIRNRGHGYSTISASGLFDVDYYLTEYPDVAEAGVDPIRHYINHGAEEFRNPSAHFTTRFYAETYPDVAALGMNPLVHYIKVGKRQGRWASHRLAVQESGFFDPAYYLMNNPDAGRSGLSAIDHYVTHGWRNWRNPSADFDLIWYAQVYLDSKWTVDPLFHYVVTGAQAGHPTRPRLPIAFRPTTSYRGRTEKPRRICLFAGYDPDGLIDPVVIEYIEDLARHADVYYLADCHIAPSELAKLDRLAKGAWAQRHGCYDFGSWSMLAQELVGWDAIDGYDELILANDSCFLMRPLENVFAEMDGRDCDWWGLQATKGIISTFATQALPEEIDLDTVKRDWLGHFEDQPTYDFLVGSYFLVLRKPVLSDQCVRGVLNSVQEEIGKIHLIRKYEIGLTRLLISLGYDFDTFIRKVYPHQPIYTETSFALIEQGFPLLKKYHLIENHYKIPNLGNWKNKVLESGVSKSLAPYEGNLRRTADAAKIYKSHDIELFELNPPLSNAQLIAMDRETPKYDDWWVFPVCAYNHLFGDNIRALFEEVKNDPKIKKIVLTRSKAVDVDGVNVVVLPLSSREGQFYLLRARHVFLKHGVRSNLGVRLSPELHCFHNLWHGIPLKRIGYASLDSQHRLNDVAEENKLLTSVISASQVDRNAMATAYWPLTINDIWLTGLPRHDLILKPERLLPNDLKDQLARLRAMLNGRKLILFAPTFRHDQQDGYYDFSPEERDVLASLLQRNGYVLGIREHMADRTRQYSSRLYGADFLAVPESLFPCVEILLREASVVATDYSSIFIDFLLTGKPVISFAYDYDHYVNSERGLFYDLEWSFPGKIAKTFGELCSAVEESMGEMSESDNIMYRQRRRLFIEYYDDRNSGRVVDCVRAVNKGDLTIFDIKGKHVTEESRQAILWIYNRESEVNARHRIFNLVPELEAMGWSSQIVASEKLSIDHVTQADVLVFCDVAITDMMLDLAEGFRRSGKKVVVDIVDQTFDRDVLMEAACYQERSEQQVSTRLRSSSLGKLMETANHISVSTPALADLMEKKGLGVSCILDSLSAATIARYVKDEPRPRSQRSEIVRICYLSDSKVCPSDLQMLDAVACRILSEMDGVEFHIVGATYEAEGGGRLAERWVRHPHLSYDAMHAFLTKMDISLALRPLNAFCQSERSFFCAGLHSVPTIASPSTWRTSFVQNGKNGLIARTKEEWYKALLSLIKNDKLRHEMGLAARRTAIKRFSSSDIAETYVDEVLKKENNSVISGGFI